MVEFPSELEVAITRSFRAPRQLMFDVLTKPEHVRKTMATFGERVTVCSIDLRVGGDYRHVFVTETGVECSFRGTFLQIEPPSRIVETWRFDGWPDAEAIETHELHDNGDMTTYTWKLAFRDAAGRAHMTKYDGPESNMEFLDAYLKTLSE